MLAAGRTLAPRAIASDWYEGIYLPAVETIRRETLERVCPGATESDLFLHLFRRRRDVFARQGRMPLVEVAHQWPNEARGGERGRLRQRLLRPRGT